MTNGYNFYFKDGSDVLTFPITPSELSIKVGSNNKTVNLISEGDINVLKSPSLIEIEFEARFPMRSYPYARNVKSFSTYFKKFEELKEKKKSFRFIVARTTPKGKRTWDTNILVALEEFELNESVDEGDDVIVTIQLKQFKEYGIKRVSNKAIVKNKPKAKNKTTKPAKPKPVRSTDNRTTSPQTYTVVSGDCLWNIAKKFYGDGGKWGTIYSANSATIEATAKRYGKKSSSNGHWIYPGTVLVIPAL